MARAEMQGPQLDGLSSSPHTNSISSYEGSGRTRASVTEKQLRQAPPKIFSVQPDAVPHFTSQAASGPGFSTGDLPVDCGSDGLTRQSPSQQATGDHLYCNNSQAVDQLVDNTMPIGRQQITNAALPSTAEDYARLADEMSEYFIWNSTDFGPWSAFQAP